VARESHLIESFEQALTGLDRLAAGQIFQALLQTRSVMDGVEALIVPTLDRIGTSWEQGRLSLAQVYMSGRICESLVEGHLKVQPLPPRPQPKLALAVLEDQHLLGKRMILSCLLAAGYRVHDFGPLEVEPLVRRTVEEGIECLLVSVLMLPSALRVKNVCEGLKAKGVSVRVVVGGAPFRFDPHLWQEVGADAVGCSASEAVSIVNRFSGAAS